jgi:hypothetical protein
VDILTSIPFIAGSFSTEQGPLARYLPPVPQGPVATWLAEHAQPCDWVLDPFGSSPQVAVEAASAGYRVLVAANNPVARFLIEIAADPPAISDLQAALAELGASRKGEERLEKHIQSLYETPCAKCRHIVNADAFVWEEKSGKIVARIYTCPHCGESGEHSPDPGDEERAARWTAVESMHRARILERVAPRDDPDREHAEEALATYLPRAVYALGTVVNRLDQMAMPPTRRRALTALMLTTCDQASVLWPYPTERPRPRQLAVPPRFRENNLWKALEDSIAIWAAHSFPAVKVVSWPQKLESGGICLFEGALRDLILQLNDLPISAAIGALPRPNHAFWTLSALWAGWLWGRQSAASFKPVLRRRRYDWQWHAEALRAAFGSLSKALPPQKPFFAFLAEPESPFVSAALLAAQESGFDLAGIAMRTADDSLQITWQRGNDEELRSTSSKGQPLQKILSAYLKTRGETTTYFNLHTASIAALASQRALVWSDEAVAQNAETVHQTLRGHTFAHFDARTSPDTGTWGLATPDPLVVPLVDRVEMAVVHHLQSHPGSSFEEIQCALNQEFPGLLTPSLGLLTTVLDSYAVDQKGWRLRPEDDASARRTNLKDMQGLLMTMGKRLGYISALSAPNLIIWQEADAAPWAFYISASAVVGKIMHTNPYPATRSVLVLPGGRAGLLVYKLRRDPTLRYKAEGWHFLKFRHLRQIAEMPLLTSENWHEIINTDPIEQNTIQMMMF